MKKPIWIKVDGGDTFEGHQAHWADCFFSNAIESEIRSFIEAGHLGDVTYEITEMTDEQFAEYPEALLFQQHLIAEYGEC